MISIKEAPIHFSFFADVCIALIILFSAMVKGCGINKKLSRPQYFGKGKFDFLIFVGRRCANGKHRCIDAKI
jgi:hypothetical protein